MSNNNGAQRVPITCEKCGQSFSVDMPPIELSNNLRTSLIICVHPRLIYCANNRCKQPRAFILSSEYQVGVGTMMVNDAAVKDVEGTSIITPALGLVQ